MNAAPSWFHRVPAIIEQLALTPISHLDRSACEELFDLRRSAAGKMMLRLGAQQIGKSLVIARPVLIARLREVMEHPSWDWTDQRRQRIREVIETAAKDRTVLIKTDPKLKGRAFDDLPGVTLVDGRLTIDHFGPQDLLLKLWALAQAISADPDRFMAQAKAIGA
jgi:hypothetical protein